MLQFGAIVVNGGKFTDILPEYQCLYNVSSRESKRRNIGEESSMLRWL